MRVTHAYVMFIYLSHETYTREHLGNLSRMYIYICISIYRYIYIYTLVHTDSNDINYATRISCDLATARKIIPFY